ncbi:hypothetical protein [Shewanella oncorhynchi]|jgi:hypothetical protein|uniref:hypothetical protein n=1 Tax=Shewanella oncorhynchi TaxID=2726434 RepID=UPI003D7A8009
MKKVIFILGVEAAKGVGKTSGKPYEFGKIHNLTPVRNWETEKGRSSSKGFTVDAEKCVTCHINALPELLRLEYPCFAEVEIDIDPEDMSSTIIVGAAMVQHFDLQNPPITGDSPAKSSYSAKQV